MSLSTLSSSILSGLQALGVLRRAVTLAEYCDAIASAVWSYGVDMSRVSSYHGVLARSTVLNLNCLPSNLTSTTFTLGATSNPITYYYQGTPVTVSADKTATLNDGEGGTTAGLYFVAFDAATGNITARKSFPGITSTSNVIIASVYWNGSNYGLVSDERHAYDRDCEWHQWAHASVGCRYRSGLDFSPTGTGATATFTMTSGEIWDEDIKFSVVTSASFPTAHALRTWYQTGASTFAFDSTTSTIPYKAGTGSRPVYVRAADYSVVTMSSAVNRYINFFIYAATDLHTPIYCFAETVNETIHGTNGHTSLTAARAIPWPNISAFGLSPELRPLYRLVVRADGAVQALTAADDYRTVSSLPQAAGTTSTTASAVSFVPPSGMTSTNVQQAIEELKALIDSYHP